MKIERHFPRAAFTLVEILVALSSLVIIRGVAYGTYAASSVSISRLRARIEAERETRALFDRLSEELRCCRAGPPAVEEKKPGDPTTGPPRPPAPPALIATPEGGLTLLTAGGIRGLGREEGGLRRVAYRLDTANRGLLRGQIAETEDTEILDRSENWLLAAREVEDFRLELSDGKTWVERWNSETQGGLPAAVRMEIIIANERLGRMAMSCAVLLEVRHDRTIQGRAARAVTGRSGHAPLP